MGSYDEALAKSLQNKDKLESFLPDSDQVESALSLGITGTDTVKSRKAATAAKLGKAFSSQTAPDAEFKALAIEANTLRQLKGLAPIREGELLEKGLSTAKADLRRQNEMLKTLLKNAIKPRK